MVSRRAPRAVLLRLIASGAMFSALLSGMPALAGTITYTYDTLGRITVAAYPGGATISHAYDAAGNRSSYTVTGSPNAPPVAPTPIGQAQPPVQQAAPEPDEAARP